MDQQTIDAYNMQTDAYDAGTKTFWEEFPPDFINTFAEYAPGRHILNIGSGPGRDAILLRDKGFELTCLDASQEMIARTKALEFVSVQGDFLNLPFEDNSFDAVWSYTSLLHVKKEEMPRALEEIKRVVKSGGICALGLINGEGEKYRASAGVSMDRLFTFYTQEELEKILEDHGFGILYSEMMPVRNHMYIHVIGKVE